MKKSLLIVSLLAVALAACSKKSDEPAKPKVEHPAAIAGKQLINVMAIQYSYDNQFLQDNIRILCVDGVEFVAYADNIVEHRDPNTGLPTTCTNKPITPASGEPQ